MIRRPPGSKRTDNTLSLHDALPIFAVARPRPYVRRNPTARLGPRLRSPGRGPVVAQDPAHPQTLLGPALLGQGILLNQVRQHHRRHRQSMMLPDLRSEEHTSELQSLMRISYAVFCLKKKKQSIYNSYPKN